MKGIFVALNLNKSSVEATPTFASVALVEALIILFVMYVSLDDVNVKYIIISLFTSYLNITVWIS